MKRVLYRLEVSLALASAIAALVLVRLTIGEPTITLMISAPFFILPLLAIAHMRFRMKWLWFLVALAAALEIVLVPPIWPFVITPALAGLAAIAGFRLLFARPEVT